MSYGHALKTAGQQRARDRRLPAQPRARAGLRRSLVEPGQPQDVPLLRRTTWPRCARELARADLADEDRLHLEFAIGKALEDEADYEPSFRHYARRQSRCAARTLHYDADDTSARVRAHPRAATRASSSPQRAGWRQRRRPTRSSSSACRAPARP